MADFPDAQVLGVPTETAIVETGLRLDFLGVLLRQCEPPPIVSVFAATPNIVSKEGGVLVSIVTVAGSIADGTIRARFGPLGTAQDPLCYSGIQGQGSTINVSGSAFTLWVPPAAVGGPYPLFIERLTGLGPSVLTTNAVITVVPHDFKSGTLRLRRILPRTWRMGYRRLDTEDLPQ